MTLRTKKMTSRRSSKLTRPSKIYQRISKALIRTVPYLPSRDRYDITLCHHNKFLWFRVPKAGTRTIFNMLEKTDLRLDAEQPFLCHYPLNLYKGYFKFAFIRNPWDRLVSYWLDKVVKKNHFSFEKDKLLEVQRFEKFVDFVANLNVESCEQHLRLQAKLIDLNNIDYLGRFENFEKDLLRITQVIGLDSVQIEKHNVSSGRLPYKDYYDKRLKDKVARIYQKDINIFSYDF